MLQYSRLTSLPSICALQSIYSFTIEAVLYGNSILRYRREPSIHGSGGRSERFLFAHRQGRDDGDGPHLVILRRRLSGD